MHNWLESNAYTGWITILLTLRRDIRRFVVRRALPAVKRVAAAVAGSVTLKVVYLYLRFFAPKELVEGAAKVVAFIVLGYIISKVMEEMLKTSEQSAA